MRRLLHPITVNNTTRFYFDIELNFPTLLKVYKEFSNDASPIFSRKDKIATKFVDIVNQKSIELNTKYISFYPKYENGEVLESIRERIYKHVAKRSDVYMRTSLDNQKLATTSLIAGDLRACASLLYYSLHKYMGSLMFSFFNDVLKMDDYQIEIEELKHFTSRGHIRFVEKGATIQIVDSENYMTILNKKVDPFLLTRYILDTEKKVLENLLKSYTNYICKKITSCGIDDPGVLKILIEKHVNLTNYSNQEEEVEFTIINALINYLSNNDDEKNVMWLLDIIAIRLYWLRQTADYAYDFEVKTSTREMSVLLSTIQGLISPIVNEDLKEENSNSYIEPESSEEKGRVYQEKLNRDQTKKFEETKIKCFNIDAKIPEDISIDHDEVEAFMTSIHLETEFEKDKIITLLNLSSNVSNEGEYYIFHSQDALTPPLCVFINRDGRWTLWVKKRNQNVLVGTSLINAFQELITSLKINHEAIYSTKFTPKLIASQPIYNKVTNNVDSLSIFEINTAAQRKIKILEKEIIKILAKIFKASKIFRNTLNVNQVEIEVRLIFDSSNGLNQQALPIYDMVLNKFKNKNSDKSYFNILVSDKVELNQQDVQNSIYHSLLARMDLRYTIKNNLTIEISPQDLTNFLSTTDKESSIVKGIVILLNNILYEDITSLEETDNQRELLEKMMLISPSSSHVFATMGLWFFRNTQLNHTEALEKGTYFYEKAKEIEFKGENKISSQIEQYYISELVRHLISTDGEAEEIKKLIDKGKSISDKTVPYQDLLELEKKFNKNFSSCPPRTEMD